MVEIITAMKNPFLNYNLKKEKNIKILYKDIRQKKDLLEKIKNNKKIKYLILNENFIEKNNLINLIKNIKKINKKIFIILIFKNKNSEIIEQINKLNYCKIFYEELNNYIDIKNFINNSTEKKLFNNLLKINSKKNNKIFLLLSYSNLDFKSLLNYIQKINNKKILIIKSKNNLKIIKKYLNSKNYSKIKKIKNNIFILNDNKYFFENIKIIKNNYDYVFIENNFNKFYINNYLKTNDKIIIFLEPKKENIKKINNFILKNEIEKNKINLIIKKNNFNLISNEIIKNYFNKIKIIGNLKNKYRLKIIEKIIFNLIIKKIIN